MKGQAIRGLCGHLALIALTWWERGVGEIFIHLARWAKATEFIRELPLAILKDALKQAESRKGKPPLKLVEIILANTRKLEEAAKA